MVCEPNVLSMCGLSWVLMPWVYRGHIVDMFQVAFAPKKQYSSPEATNIHGLNTGWEHSILLHLRNALNELNPVRNLAAASVPSNQPILASSCHAPPLANNPIPRFTTCIEHQRMKRKCHPAVITKAFQGSPSCVEMNSRCVLSDACQAGALRKSTKLKRSSLRLAPHTWHNWWQA